MEESSCWYLGECRPIAPSTETGLSFEFDPEKLVPLVEWDEKSQAGFVLSLVNRGSRTVEISSCSDRLFLIQEARGQDGTFRPIQRLPSNSNSMRPVDSYGFATLAPNSSLDFVVPRYEGSLETKLRFRLTLREEIVYSREFAGSVNPGQFVEKPEGI